MSPIQVVHNAYTAKETVELVSRAGVAKANMRIDKIFASSVLAGMYLAFACAASLSTQTAPWYQENAPGLIRMIGAIIFPFGLTMIIVTGADLCTGSFMYTTVAVLHRRLSVVKMLMHWVITFFGNLAGSLFIVSLIIGYGGVFDADPYRAEVLAFANKKAVTPHWHMIFLRGIGANWLVCLACFLAFMAREFFSKVAAIWWPTFAFVCLGLDHVVANMFFIPAAIWQHDPEITVGYYIWKSMIPALIGNIIGGGLLVGVVYWYMYLTGDSVPVPIDGSLFEIEKQPLMGVRQLGAAQTDTVDSSSDKEQQKSAEHMV